MTLGAAHPGRSCRRCLVPGWLPAAQRRRHPPQPRAGRRAVLGRAAGACRAAPSVALGWAMVVALAAAARGAEAPAFYLGINLNGPALEIDGHPWQGHDSRRYTAVAKAFENQQVPLQPETDEARARMIRSSRWGDVDIAVRDVPPGEYSVFLYVWEDNHPERFRIALNGVTVVPQYTTGPAGRWERLGPWHVRVADGVIRLTTQGGAANISGLEIWTGRVAASADTGPSVPPEALAFFALTGTLRVEHCYQCHSAAAKTVEAGLWLDSRPGVLRGGESGPAVVAGEPDRSRLIRAVRYDDPSLQMPPGGKLPPEAIAALEQWVRLGVPDPRSESEAVALRKRQALDEARQFWSLQPVRSPPLPAVSDTSWPHNEIDYFILAGLEARGLRPLAAADRYTLVRRATFDLLGLPPDPADVEAFVADPRPLNVAFADVVERLLASPHYGERWGRHWMDLVRYADTAGDNSDYPVPQLYLYRNYVIDSFNADKPYDQFLREQIAGDLLPADSPQQRNEQIIATGYIALARRFGSIVKDYPQHLTIEDTIDNLGRTVLGLSVACARCHDHKFDCISREDYYGLYGIFESTRYPFPGIELDKKPRDLVPLAPVGDTPGDLAYAVAEGRPADARLHRRGDPKDLGDVVPRKFLDVLGGQHLPPEAAGSSGRLHLARWLTDPANPLTPRVMVNRIWQYHFGAGLVRTPSDFGVRGTPPTHPELLDFLAYRFMADGWSLKQMHRLIMASRTYQLASADDPHNLARDPDNHACWRYPRRRLDAESLRDAVLAISGRLDRSMMRQPHPFPPVESWNFTQHHPFRETYPSHRRSVYLMTGRLVTQPYFATFDGPDRNVTTPQRDQSVTSLQALFLLNDPFVHEQAAAFAERLLREQPDDDARLRWAFALALGRPPRDEERQAAEEFFARLRAVLGDGASDPAALQRQLWESFARVLFRTNEFLYVD